MRRLLLAMAVLLALGGSATAELSVGQDRFAAGDHAGAYAAWLPLAEAGDAKAQYSLGVMHQRGLGRAKDPVGAAAWFERAARQDYAPASAALERMGKLAAAASATTATDRERVELALRSMFGRSSETAVGSIRVTEAEAGAFDVVIEGLRFTSGPQGPSSIGPLSARATRAGDDAWRFDFATPPPLDGLDRAGEPFRLRIGGGRSIVHWSEELEAAAGLDLDWRNVTYEMQGPPMRIARVRIRSELERKGGDRWTWPGELRIEDLEIAEPGKGVARLGALSMRMVVAGPDLPALARLSRSAAGQSSLGSLQQMRGLFSDATLEFGLERFHIDAPQGRHRLAEGGFRLAFAKLHQAAFDLEIGYRHVGLSADGAQPIHDLAPQEAELKVTILRAPMEALLQTGIAAGLEYMLLGQLNSAPALLEKLRTALPEAGTQLRIDAGLFRAAKAQATAAGAFAADAAAPFGVVGALGLSVIGMDEIVKAATQPDAAPAHNALAALARRGERASDGKALLYRFELGRDGRALVNGRPLADLFAE